MTAAAANQETADAQDVAREARPRRMLSEPMVRKIVPVSAVTLWRMERDGRFPKGSYISANRKIWFEDEIIAWQNEINGRGRGSLQHPPGAKS
jgi:prophage regulatory protein